MTEKQRALSIANLVTRLGDDLDLVSLSPGTLAKVASEAHANGTKRLAEKAMLAKDLQYYLTEVML